MDKIYQRFIQASIKYGHAQEKGRTELARLQNESLKKLRHHVKNHKVFELENFATLLEHENNYVRLKAAVSIIPVLPDESEKVLRELSGLDEPIGKEALILLELWKNRGWK